MNAETALDNFDQGQPELAAHEHEFKISLSDLWQIAQMRYRLILGTAGTIILLVALIVMSLTPRYTGSTLLAINNQQNNVVNIPAVMNGLPADQPTILTQLQILQSNQTAERVITKLKLNLDPEFNPDLGRSWLAVLRYLNPLHWLPSSSTTPGLADALARQRIVDVFSGRLNVQQIELSTAIQLDFESRDPAKAAMIANAVADTYVDEQLDTKFDANMHATKWLSGRLGELSSEANAAETAVENYKISHHLTDTASASGVGSVSVLDQQLAQMNSQLMQAQTQRAQAEATADRVQFLVRSGHAEQVNQVLSSPLIAQYRQQEALLAQQIAQMASRYGPEHPKMLDLQASKRDLETKVNEEINNVVGTVNNDVVVARASEEVLRSKLAQMEHQSGVQGQDRIDLANLQAAAGTARTLYDMFAQRAKETEQEQGLLTPDVRILSRASIPSKVSFPKRFPILALTVPVALMLAYMLAFGIERLDRGFRAPSRAEEVLGYPVFAVLPVVSDQRGNPSLDPAACVVDKPLSAFAEAIRGLQLGIMTFNGNNVPKKVVLITSAVPGEGKTTTAVSLARHVSQTGQKVVLVDGDLRRPTIFTFSGLVKPSFDLIDVLGGRCTLNQALIQDAKSAVAILPICQQVTNPAGLIGSPAMAKVLAELRMAFDCVVIDSAPVLPVNDTRILSQITDAVLFAVRWEETPRGAACAAVKSLRDAQAPIAGLVLTRADPKRLSYYSFGYSNYQDLYSQYYGS